MNGMQNHHARGSLNLAPSEKRRIVASSSAPLSDRSDLPNGQLMAGTGTTRTIGTQFSRTAKTEVERLRQEVLESWTLTEHRSRNYTLKDAEREARQGKKRPKPERVDWLPFTVLLEMFEKAVRREENSHP